MDDGRSPSWFVRGIAHACHSLASRYFSVIFYFVSGLNAWIVVYFLCMSEYLVAVDLTSHVGTIPTWLGSYFLV